MVNITRPIFCQLCGQSFTAKGNGAKYCPDCGVIIRRDQTRELREIERQTKPKPTKDKYIIVSYDPQAVDFNEEMELIALIGRLLSPEMLADLQDTLPPGVCIQHNEQRFIIDEIGKLIPLPV
jgi:predicted RNA-binding Zn-ribbon protein involved in translation (DUF1610 family)